MLESELLNKFYKHCSDYESGIECAFVRLDRKFGVKLYSTSESRDFAYDLQEKLYAKHGLAPPIYNKFCLKNWTLNMPMAGFELELVMLSGYRLYGYVTAVASKPKVCSKFYTLLDKLEDRIKELKLPTGDIHDDNVGYYNHKLVLIDCGPVSMK